MVDKSHNPNYFNRYIRKIDDIIEIDEVIPWELYNVSTPYDLTINDLNFEIKIQSCLPYKFALEQYTDHNQQIRGCIHNLKQNDVDIIVFFYPTQNLIFALHAKDLQNWWENNCDKYEIFKNRVTRDDKGGIWQSSFSYVFINDLPEDIIWYTDIKRKEKALDGYM